MNGEIDIVELINKTKRGDKKAQESLYKYFKLKINYFLKKKYPKCDIEDDCSDILLKIFEKIDDYDINKSKFNTWVINIAKNHMIDKSRKQKPLYTSFMINNDDDFSNEHLFTTNSFSDSYFMYEPTSYYCAPDHDVEISSSLSYLSTTISSVDLHMFCMKNSGYNYKEIGLEFNMSESQISNKMNYTKSKLKEKGEK